MLFYFLASLSGFVLAFFVLPRSSNGKKKRQSRTWIYFHTEDTDYIVRAKQTNEGYQPLEGEIVGDQPWDVPASAITRTVLLPGSGDTLHFVYTERVALLDHRAWDVSRRPMGHRTMPAFRTGTGGGTKMLKMVASLTPLVISFYLLMQIGDLQNSLDTVARMSEPLQQLSIQVDQLQQAVDSGVEVR
jgi:hypothetical protein